MISKVKLVVLIVTVIGFMMLSFGLLLQADTKPIPELIALSTQDHIPEFREAASKALTTAFIILSRPLEELEEIAMEALRTKGFPELMMSIEEAKGGYKVSVCRLKPDPESFVFGGLNLLEKDINELRRLATTGSAKLGELAAKALVELVIQSVGMDFTSYYTFRLEHEVLFDEIKLQLTRLIAGSFSPQIRRAAIEPLAQIFLAEFLITLKPRFVREKVECT